MREIQRIAQAHNLTAPHPREPASAGGRPSPLDGTAGRASAGSPDHNLLHLPPQAKCDRHPKATVSNRPISVPKLQDASPAACHGSASAHCTPPLYLCNKAHTRHGRAERRGLLDSPGQTVVATGERSTPNRTYADAWRESPSGTTCRTVCHAGLAGQAPLRSFSPSIGGQDASS